ncbi:MAG: phospholipid methyltransferase, partial [Paracraurococcus sp.]
MSGMTAGEDATRRREGDPWLFFRRWLANPLQMGSVAPSAPSLCRRIAALVRRGPGAAALLSGPGRRAVSGGGLPGSVTPLRLE